MLTHLPASEGWKVEILATDLSTHILDRARTGIYPMMRAAQIPTSYGGIVYMMASLCLLAIVIMIEAVPVAAQLRAWQHGQRLALTPPLMAAGLAVIVICFTGTLVPLRLAARRLELMEW